jgi:ribonuclease R
LARRFANSIISSTQRLTYQQAERALKGHTKNIKPEVIVLLKDMETLSLIIEKRRTKNGMLHLDLPQTELVMDESGWVVDAHPADTSYPHTIIEMFMVEANEAVATILDRQNISFMRRIHPDPDVLSTNNLSQLVRAFGLSLPKTPSRTDIQDLLDYVKGRDSSFAVNMAVLRSFEKAEYAPSHIGHYALASTHYCHFTSPIRRYADLLVHRTLEYYLQNRLDSAKQETSGLDLAELGKHITFAEQQAEDAERELTNVLLLQMLSKRIGDELDCVITGLTNFGVFVQSKKFGIEGLIQMSDLGPGQWKFDKKSQSIAGQSGHNIRLGNSMKVHIVSVNVPARQLNLAPVKPLSAPADKTTKGKAAKKIQKGKMIRPASASRRRDGRAHHKRMRNSR